MPRGVFQAFADDWLADRQILIRNKDWQELDPRSSPGR